MGALALKQTELRRFDRVPMSLVPALLTADPWESATAEKRRVAQSRLGVIEPLLTLVANGASVSRVVAMFMVQLAAGELHPRQVACVDALGRKGLSAPNLRRWIADYRSGGKVALLPAHTGRMRQERDWDEIAIQKFNIPSKPGYKDVAEWLRMEGHADASPSLVRRLIQSLPANQGAMSADRIGHHLHHLSHGNFQPRSLEDTEVGEIYAGDGHRVDTYTAKPGTGYPMRLELTAFIDIKTGFIAGWYYSDNESGDSTLEALSHSMQTHNHVPTFLYIDHGAGYRSKMLADVNAGFYNKYDMTVVAAIPGNPHGKGWIERFFLTYRNRFDKLYLNGRDYCGDDGSPDTLHRMSELVRSGKRKLSSNYDYIVAFKKFLDHYHNTLLVQRGETPNEGWARLVRNEVYLDTLAIMRPAKMRAVARSQVILDNRHYHAPELALFDGSVMKVEYSQHDDACVWVYDGQGRFVCKAELVKTIGVLLTSRKEEAKLKSLAGAIKRKERAVQELIASAQDAITVDMRMSAIDALTAAPPNKLIAPRAKAGMSPFKPKNDVQDVPYVHPEDDFDIDITDYQP